ncbi:MAG: ATP-binding cassette domain-containing protein [Actinobacteria bacterium]|nr:ATP-binding cassette domain-containing protein [Actinomycetota bacterium]
MTAEASQVTALLGPNGAGKTTTVEVACGLRTATSGQVRLLGAKPGSRAVAERIGVMLQQGGLYPTARPLEWLQYLARLYPSHADPSELLDLVGIDPATRTTTRRLSGGEQQRVKLAAALLPNPEFLILDEPTAGLDPLARRNLLEAIGARRDAGMSILLTTHQLSDVEALADRVVVIAGGRIVAEGTVSELTGANDAMSFRATPGLDLTSLAAALPDASRVQEPRPGSYVVHGPPSPQVMAAITAWCAQQGVMATDLAVGQRTLEQIVIDAGSEPS